MTVVSETQRRTEGRSQCSTRHGLRRAGAFRLTGAQRVLVGIAAAASSVVLLAGCAAGKDAQTVEQKPAIDGVSADSATIGIRDAGVAAPETGTSYPAGSDAPLRLYVVNNGTADDKLTAVSSDASTSALLTLTGPPGTSSTSTSGSASESASPSASGSASATGSASASASASGSGSGSTSGSVSGSASPSAAATSVPIPIPANSSVAVGYSAIGPTIILQHLNKQLFTSQTVQVTFTFASGVTITAALPVQLTSGGASAPTVDISPTGG
jgi:copper(I)-binding protein